jgi:hypothetical protein
MRLAMLEGCSSELLELLKTQDIITTNDILISDPFEIYQKMPPSTISLADIKELRANAAEKTAAPCIDAYTLLMNQVGDDLEMPTYPSALHEVLAQDIVLEISGGPDSYKDVKCA